MAAKIPPQKIADCRELYLRYGGQRHARIVAEMRARGWAEFTKRNLYVRTRNGRPEPGWPERFGWEAALHKPARKQGRYTHRSKHLPKNLSVPPAVAGGLRQRRSKQGIAYSRRRTSAREHTVLDRPTAFETPKPKCNRQKMRRLRKKRSADTLVRTDAASAFGRGAESSNVRDHNARHAGGTGVAGEGARAPGLNSIDSANSTDSKDFHSWLKTLPSIWNWDARHQLYLYEHLQKVTDGTCKRLMIFMPPRHGKSELVTVRYTAWRLRQDPSLNVILASYGQDLANRFSRKIKRVLIDDFAAAGNAGAVAGNAGAVAGNAGAVAGNAGAVAGNAGAVAGNAGAVAGNAGSPACTDAKASGLHADIHVRHAGGTGVAGEGACAPGASPFPFVRQRPANRVSEWETTMGGGLRAVGVGAGVTGYGAKLIVIDDPVKSREQANSLRFRNRLWDWFNDDLYTRLEPGGSIVLIQTRWHEDDLAGRLLKDAREGGEEWEVVNLPALAERSADTPVRTDAASAFGQDGVRPQAADDDDLDAGGTGVADRSVRSPTDPLGRTPGEALWPEMYGVEYFEEIRRRQGEFSFAALYQQRPVPAEGGVFKREWFANVVDHAPSGLDWKRGYDLAVSTKQTADYTASFRVAYDKENNLYIDGGFRRRIGFPEQKRYIAERLTLERDTEHGIELALHGHAVMQELRRDIKVQGRRFKGVRAKGDKQTRALKWQSLAAEGRLRLVRGPWVKTFIEEACSFPHGSHDDQIDAVSLAVSMHDNRGSKLVIF